MQTEYNGHTISVTPEFHFKVEGPLFAEAEDNYIRMFASLAEAREKIDTKMKAAERQARVKLSIPMLGKNGKPVIITGVHGGHFKALGVGDNNIVYPPNPMLREMLHQAAQMSMELRELNRKIDSYRVLVSPDYGTLSYEHAVESLQKRIAAASQKAQQELGATSAPAASQGKSLSR